MSPATADRRRVLLGLGAGLGCLLAGPAVVRAASLMPVRGQWLYFSYAPWSACPSRQTLHRVPAWRFMLDPVADALSVETAHVGAVASTPANWHRAGRRAADEGAWLYCDGDRITAKTSLVIDAADLARFAT